MDTTNEAYCKHLQVSRNCYSCFIERQEEQYQLSDALKLISDFAIRIAKLEEYKRLQDDINQSLHAVIGFCDEHRKKQSDENRAVSKHFDNLKHSVCEARKQIGQLDDFQNQQVVYITEIKDQQSRDVISLNSYINMWLNQSGGRMQEIETQQRHDMARITHLNEWLIKIDTFRDSINSHDEKINILLLKLNTLEAAFKESQELVPFDEDDYIDEADESEPPVILNLVNNNGEQVQFVGRFADSKETLCMDKFTKPKTTGLTFEEAYHACKSGKNVRFQNHGIVDCMDDHIMWPTYVVVTHDWEIVL